MSIVRLKKATIIGLSPQQDVIIKGLQSLGCLHLIPLTSAALTSESVVSDTLQPETLNKALLYLVNCPSKRRQVTQLSHFDLNAVVEDIEQNRKARLQQLEQGDFLRQRIQDLKPWGEFHLPPVSALAGQKLWFYLLPNVQLAALKTLELPWACVHRDERQSHIVVISEQEPVAGMLPVPRIHTGYVPLSQLEQELEDTQIHLEALEAQRLALTRWIYALQSSVAATQDATDRQQASQQVQHYDEVFVLQGWLPEDKVIALEDYAQSQSLALIIDTPALAEQPPTLLQNGDWVGGGELLVQFFQTPSYRSWDPSRIVFFSFVAFFAIIMSDAGYSLLCGALLALYWRKLETTQRGRRLRSMALTLVGFGVIWGVLVGSYFGINPTQGVLAQLQRLDLYDFDSMMRLSIIIGAGHLILANGMMAWVRRHSLQAWSSVGWAMAVLFGLLAWLEGLGGWQITGMSIGLFLVVAFSNSRPALNGRSALSGVLALTNVTKIFGDVLSYLRLFALGLASASLALTFNQLAGDVAQALPGIGLLLQGLILLFGHALNFVLTVASGVIHGLRLNLIEFYNWSLADEGYPFQPFSKREVTPWIT